jgi:hypothetical protein
VKRQSGNHDRPREARLRAASAHLYPGITPEVWVQAATLADIIWARRLHRGEAASYLGARVLDPAHFEFRHAGQPTQSVPLRRRATDRLRHGGD